MILREERIGGQRLILGDCLERMAELPDNSVDSVVTDPPYGLSFMGKRWDYDVPSVEIWVECLRVLKPGGHLLAFAGTRTQHRMAVRIEDAGFEIRDMIAWVYGSGFPKSLDVSKAIDKAAGATGGYGDKKPNVHSRGDHALHEGWKRPWQDDPEAVDKSGREYLPATDAASQWQGWGTALKPSLEPVTVARKPLIGTVAENVLTHGTGAINVDACRVAATPEDVAIQRARTGGEMNADIGNEVYQGGWKRQPAGNDLGRWPANLIHDGSPEVLAGFPWSKSGALTAEQQKNGGFAGTVNAYGKAERGGSGEYAANGGSAARFFYCAKASKRDRDEANNHPTVKPTDLMRYLCRLVTPPGGVVLDPFMGSGSTGKAAEHEGFRFIGIERDPEYFNISRHRIAAAWAVSLQKGFDL